MACGFPRGQCSSVRVAAVTASSPWCDGCLDCEGSHASRRPAGGVSPVRSVGAQVGGGRLLCRGRKRAGEVGPSGNVWTAPCPQWGRPPAVAPCIGSTVGYCEVRRPGARPAVSLILLRPLPPAPVPSQWAGLHSSSLSVQRPPPHTGPRGLLCPLTEPGNISGDGRRALVSLSDVALSLPPCATDIVCEQEGARVAAA